MLNGLHAWMVKTNALPRVLGLRLIVLVELVAILALRALPAGGLRELVSDSYAPLVMGLSVVAGYYLRSRWALLLTPLVAWGGLIVVSILTGNLNVWADLRDNPVLFMLFLVAPGIPYALLALLGVKLAERRSRLRREGRTELLASESR